MFDVRNAYAAGADNADAKRSQIIRQLTEHQPAHDCRRNDLQVGIRR